jgi:hypothetical protein
LCLLLQREAPAKWNRDGIVKRHLDRVTVV